MDDYEVVAEELSQLGEKWRDLEERVAEVERVRRDLDERVAEVERVNARLEEAALTTARALGEVSRHWDAVYDAMRRADRIDKEISSERDHDAARARRGESSD
jgi:predicted nuclease with TOPRIM domain